MGKGHVGQDRQFEFAIDFPDLDAALRFENPLLLRQRVGPEVERLDTLLDADREPDRLRRPGALDAIGAKFAADARVEHGEFLLAAREGRRIAIVIDAGVDRAETDHVRSEEHTSELQSLMRISYAVFRL